MNRGLAGWAGASSMLVISCVSISSPAWAQSVDEIVVTAQKREQSLNKVGLSVTAISGDTLKKNNVVSLEDIALTVPGLSFATTVNNTPVYSLRGVGLQDATIGVYPAVSLYLDEVPLPFPILTSNTSFDLERLEVLKGPQGTLFGQNSTGGAINFIAAKPKSTFGAGADLSYSRFNTVLADAFITGPIADGLNARAAVRINKGDNWQRSYTHGGGAGAPETFAGRLLLDWRASDAIRFQFNANGWIDKSTPQEAQFIEARPINPAPTPASDAEPAPHNNRATDFTPDSPRYRDNKFGQLALRSDIDLGSDITLTSISSYISFKRDEAFNLDGLALRALDATRSTGSITSFNQEVRLANGGTQPIRWIIGANYSRDKADENNIINYQDSTIANLTMGLLDRGGSRGDQKMTNTAAFANVEADVLSDVTLKGGIRYTRAKRNMAGCTYDIGNRIATFFGLLSNSPIAEGACATFVSSTQRDPAEFRGKLDEDNVSWRVGADWRVKPDILLYANVAKGYKAGSFPVLAAATFAQFVPAKQESLLDYEAGAKISLLDRKLQINLAGFYYKYQDKQLRTTLIDPVFGPLDVLGNIPKSSVKGFEVDATARPFAGLSVGASFTYLDAQIDRFSGYNGGGTFATFDNTSMPLTPKYQAGAQVDYRFPIGDAWQVAFGSSLTVRSKTNATLGSDPAFDLKGYTLVDLRASFGPTDGLWNVQVWGKNVFDTFYRTNVVRFQDVVIGYSGRPAMYGATLSVRY
jgi:iron complex outermembrane receptor protein